MSLAELPEDERLAAEYALGLLEGEDLLGARGRIANDPAFARSVERWQERLAPILDEIGEATPPADMWARIEAQLDGAAARPTGEVIALRRSLQRWRIAGIGTSIAATVLLAALIFQPLPDKATPDAAPTIAAAQQAPLVASIPIADTPLRIGVTYLPDREELLVSANGLTADGVHDHELWLVPADDSPLRSLGVITPGEDRRVSLDAATAQLIGDGSNMLLTREPLGGKPEGQDAGPVVAEGAFQAI